MPNSTLTIVPGEGHFAGFATVLEVLEKVRSSWPKPAAKRKPKPKAKATRGTRRKRSKPAGLGT